jgi:hypothetical protein
MAGAAQRAVLLKPKHRVRLSVCCENTWPNRSLRRSSSDNLVPEEPACSVVKSTTQPPGQDILKKQGHMKREAVRKVAVHRAAPAANNQPASGSITFGGGTIVGRLVSICTRSGGFSTELILMTGLSTPLRTGSETGCGKHQLIPNSKMTSAVPTKPKYFFKGIAVSARRPVSRYRWWSLNGRLKQKT